MGCATCATRKVQCIRDEPTPAEKEKIREKRREQKAKSRKRKLEEVEGSDEDRAVKRARVEGEEEESGEDEASDDSDDDSDEVRQSPIQALHRDLLVMNNVQLECQAKSRDALREGLKSVETSLDDVSQSLDKRLETLTLVLQDIARALDVKKFKKKLARQVKEQMEVAAQGGQGSGAEVGEVEVGVTEVVEEVGGTAETVQ